MDSILDFLNEFGGGRIALAVHQRPDGDALGSAMGLAAILRNSGGSVKLVSPLPLPEHLSFIVDSELVVDDIETGWWNGFDCLGVLDCGEAGRLEPVVAEALPHLPVFTIDHHASSAGLGRAIWVEPKASSTGEMIVRLASRADWFMPPFAAQALWTAIITDTGRFCFENTHEAALEAACACLKAGASPAMVAAALYQSVTVPERRLQLRVLERMELLAGGRLAVSWLTDEDFRQAGIGVEGAQNLVNILRDTEGVDVAVFLYEPAAGHPNPKNVKASFRTNSPYDALAVTSRFGGGGHQRAAGCSLPGPIGDAAKLIIEAAAKEYFPDVPIESLSSPIRIGMA